MNCRSHYLSSRAISVAIFNGLGRLLRRRLLAMTGKMIILLLFLGLTFALYASPTFAQTPASSTSKESKPTFEVSRAIPTTIYQLPPTISPTSPLYTDLIVNNMFHTFSCLAVGQSVIGQPCLTYQVTKNAQGAIQSVPVLSQVNLSGGALGATTSLIGMLYMNPPVRTADYLASVGEGMGIVKTANAQVVGSGAAVLNPILKLWQVSRNISYVIMIIIFVIIGLMIMFRNKINPQTVITAQTALPGLVIGLILITFSYFLAGLISDMAFVGTNIVGYYFSSVRGQTNPPQNLVQEISNDNAMTIMGQMLNGIGRDPIGEGVRTFINNLPNPAGGYLRAGITLAAYQIGSSFGPGLGAIAGMVICGAATLPFLSIPGINIAAMGGIAVALPVCATLGSTVGGPLAGGLVAVDAIRDPANMVSLALWFIAMLVIIYAIFRLLMKLINTFLTIIFLVITAPFQLLIAALPGRQGIATNWMLNILGNVLVFPAVLAVLYFAAFILGQSFGPLKVSSINQQNNSLINSVSADESTTNKISITDKQTFPLFGGMNLGFLNILLAFGALVALPAIPDIVVKSIGRMGQAGQLIGQEIGSSIAGGQRYYGRAQGGLGAIQKDIGGMGQFATQTQYEYDKTGKNIIGIRRIPGLGAKFHPPTFSAGQKPSP